MGRGNEQSPEPDGDGAGPSGPQVSDADIPATQAVQPVEAEMPAIEPEPTEAEPKPRRRGRPRKSDAANGAAKDSKPAAEEAEAKTSWEADGAGP